MISENLNQLIEYRDPDWVGKINFDHLEKLSALGYTPEQCAMFFDIPKLEFMYFYMLVDSKLKFHYERGVLFHKAKEGMTMLEDAETGSNVTNAQRLDKLRREIDFKNAVNRICYGDI
ncbi:MAG: hypothetical protein PHV20_12390 [Bacteroidales bacterium]|nr:hypothetical protein [Bacteroidales bacterium]